MSKTLLLTALLAAVIANAQNDGEAHGDPPYILDPVTGRRNYKRECLGK